MSEIHCYCGNTIEFETNQTYSIPKNPDLVKKILEGSFQILVCEDCGREIKPEWPVTIEVQPGEYCYFAPEIDRNSILLGNYPSLSEKTTIVIGFAELQERIRMLQDNMKPLYIEAIKFILQARYAKGKEDTVRFYYFSHQDSMHFHVYGLKEEEIGILKIPFDYYRKQQKDFEQNPSASPFKELLEHPYLSCNRLYTGEEE